MSRIARLLGFLSLVVGPAIACTEALSLEDRACPCVAGWTCCAARNVCLAAGQVCSGIDAAPDAGRDAEDAALVTPPIGCKTNAECLAKDPNQPSICRKSDHRCVAVRSTECTSLIGEELLNRDDVTIVGAIVPLGVETESDGDGGTIDLIDGVMRQAHDEITGVDGGLQHPMVIVECQDQGFEPTVAAATHLVKDLKAPILIGPEEPANATAVSQSLAPLNDFLMIAPAPTDAVLKPYAWSDGSSTYPHVWSLDLSERPRARALQAFLEDDLLTRLSADVVRPGEDLRIGLIEDNTNESHYYTLANSDVLRWTLPSRPPASCSPDICRPFVFGHLDPNGNDQALPDLLAVDEKHAPPHLLLGEYRPSSSNLLNVLFAVEESWGADPSHPLGARPYHVLVPSPPTPLGTFVYSLFDTVSAAQIASGELPVVKRLFGLTVRANEPAILPDGVARFDRLARLHYDAVYLAAFALAAVDEPAPTGLKLAATLPRVVGEGDPTTAIGPADFGKALSDLRAGATLHLRGTSGDLDLDPTTGVPRYKFEITCLGRDEAGKTNGLIGSGFVYDPDPGQKNAVVSGQGTVFDPTKTSCPYLK